MKKILLSLFILSSFQNSIEGFLSKNESSLADNLLRRAYLCIPRKELFNDKAVKGCTDQMKKECDLLKIDFKEILKKAIALVDVKIEFYEKINKQNKMNWYRPCKYLCLSIACALLLYYFYTMDRYCERQAHEIRSKLNSLGPDMFSLDLKSPVLDWNCSIVQEAAVTLIPSDNTKNLRRKELLTELARFENNNSFGDNFVLFGGLGLGSFFWGIMGINDILDQKYSEFYRKKYGLIKNHFQLFLDKLG